MPLQDYECFKGVSHIRRDDFMQNLLYSLIDWLKWSTLQIGGFQNIDFSSVSGIYGGHFSLLRRVHDPNYDNGQVWEAFRSDWVWETGISYDPEPNFCSGIYVDDVFYPTATATGTYAHHINFPLGRVVFSSAIPSSAVVNADFSHRTVSYVKSSESWFQEILFDSYRIDRQDFLGYGSGQWDQLAQTRRHMPVVGIELAGRRFEPYELGSSNHYVYQDVIMYILTENEDERNQIVDILSQQHDKVIWTYNRGKLKEGTNFLGESIDYPYDLDINGSPISNVLQFPDLVAPTGDGGFRYRNVVMGDVRIQVMDNVNGWLWRGLLRTTFEGIV